MNSTFIFMGPCIVRYRGGIYDQQDETNSRYLLLEIAFLAINIVNLSHLVGHIYHLYMNSTF
jgi:hypothetical protein